MEFVVGSSPRTRPPCGANNLGGVPNRANPCRPQRRRPRAFVAGRRSDASPEVGLPCRDVDVRLLVVAVTIPPWSCATTLLASLPPSRTSVLRGGTPSALRRSPYVLLLLDPSHSPHQKKNAKHPRRRAAPDACRACVQATPKHANIHHDGNNSRPCRQIVRPSQGVRPNAPTNTYEWNSRTNWGSHIDTPHSWQLLVKGERLVRNDHSCAIPGLYLFSRVAAALCVPPAHAPGPNA